MTAALFDLWYHAEVSSPDTPSGARGILQRRPTSSRVHLTLPPGLIEQINSGDVVAFEMLVRTVMLPLVRFAYSFVRARDVAEDVVQDVLARVWQTKELWHPSDAIAYLFTTVRNDALKTLRHRAIEAKHAASIQQEWIPDATTARLLGPDELLLWQERMRAFESVLEGLTERQRSAFVLRYEQGLTVPSIAHVLGISTKAAEKLVARVTATLRDRLREVR